MANVSRLTQELPVTTSASSSGNSEGWLKQLESAQWQQRLRYQSQGESSLAQRQDSGSQDKPLADSRNNGAHEQPEPYGKTRSDIDQAGGARHSGMADKAVTAQSKEKSVGNPVAPALGASENGIVREGMAGEEPELHVPQPRRYIQADWKATNAHVMLGAEEVKVWLRDARLQNSEGLRLLTSLRGHFARLGLRLSQLTLNGTRIVETESIE